MYHVGKVLAKRYDGYLSSSPQEIYIRSSGVERCLESVEMILAGLNPPKGEYVLSSYCFLW